MDASTTRNGFAHQATRLDALGGRFDPWLLGCTIALACLGVVMVGSAAVAGAGMDVGPWYFLTRHVMFLGAGLVLAALLMRSELKFIEQRSQLLLLGCFALLLLVFVPGIGRTVNGAQRWINLGVSNFQAVEAVKLLYIVWLASYLKRYSEDVAATWPAMLKPLGVAVALVGLLLLQPDFGSSTLLLAITAGMLVLGGVNLPRMSMPIVFGLPVFAFIAILEPYRLRRFTSFLDPWADQLGSGYQLSNALMAVGRGEWFGVGLGASVQKLSYLPEAHTDFIMAVIAEELGFAGVVLVVGLFALLVGRAFWLGLKCVEMRRHFAGYCAFGIGLWIGLQSLVSIGVNLGLLPTKGLTLPLISSGGSSVLMTCAALGLLPTKGLTLPLISSGGSSVLMTCAALGLLLRVSYEYDRAARQVAKLRGVASGPSVGTAPHTSQPPLVNEAVSRGSNRLRQRVEPSLGPRDASSPDSAAQTALRRSR